MATTPSRGNRAGFDRLAHAFALLDARHAGRGSASTDAEFLADHQDVRDILEPLLQTSERARTTTSPQDPVDPERIGPYEVLERIGEGGMGVVYLAEQSEPIHRRVAVKLVREPTAQAIARFDAERQALERMQHPNVARVLDAGELQSGRPWFAMEYVGGRPILDYVRSERLDLDARLRLFVQVCDGVQHAHRKGVLHRDLKPSNVLVVASDAGVRPVVIDFGVAKALGDSRLTDLTIVERTGHVVGTPECMAPEQLEGRPELLDIRTDVYALGLLLYRLACGSPAFEFGPHATVGSIEKTIRERLPERPSARLATSSGEAAAGIQREFGRSTSSLARALRSEIDWIVLMALEKDPERRFPTAAALADDVERARACEPIRARPPSWSYVTRRFLARRRGLVLAISAVVLALAIGLGLAVWQRDAAIEEAEKATAARIEWDRLANFVRLEKARDAATELRPAHPNKLPALRAWRTEHAEPLIASLPGLREAMRASAELGERTGESLHFDRPEDEFLHDSLVRLVGAVEGFAGGLAATVAERERWAERVEELSIDDHAAAWRAAAEAIRRADGEFASSLYLSDPPLELRPQLGLVPIGKNPSTGLWEFYHLRSAREGTPIPNVDDYDASGVLPVDGDSGIVFALIPGGTFSMGSQNVDEALPNYDPESQTNERPVHAVTLAPFFLARHELTQGQWQRLGRDGNPSALAGEVPLSFPVESVSWDACRERMEDHGLVLPTEAQWEYACRAGSTTPWWTGFDRESLRTEGLTANLADASARASGARWSTIGDWPGYHDGIPIYGAPTVFRPNPFGLHHVHGNLFEWCLDSYLPYATPPRSGDGLRIGSPAGGGDVHVARGGSFNFSAGVARAANRHFLTGSAKFNILGLRAARAVAP